MRRRNGCRRTRRALDAAVAGVRRLNEQYAAEGASVFFLLHRPRQWNDSERRWIGYERKRGKLEQFNRLIREGATEPFSVIEGDVAALRAVKYVITLDTDTQLPLESRLEDGRHDGPPAEPAADQPGHAQRGKRLRRPAAAPGRHASSNPGIVVRADCSAARRASTRIPAKLRTCTRTSSARGCSPARESTTCRRFTQRSPGASRRTGF